MYYAYCDGLLIVGQDAAESLQVSLFFPEGQLQSPHLGLSLFQTVELVIDGALQTTKGKNCVTDP